MKKLLIIAFSVMVLFAGCAHKKEFQEQITAEIEAIATGISYEGELNPNEFDAWELISILPGPISGLNWSIVQNPDPTATIQKAALLYDLNSVLVVYQYFNEGEPYSLWFDQEENKYIVQPFTAEERAACMKCHKPKQDFVY